MNVVRKVVDKLFYGVLGLLAGVLVAISLGATAQMIYGNTFPFWNVTGPLVVNGTSTLSGGIVGTTTNDSATTGNVGEYIISTLPSSSYVTGAATGVSRSITSISLTPGDWRVSGTCNILGSTLITTVLQCGLGTATDTLTAQTGGQGLGPDPVHTLVQASATMPNTALTLQAPEVRFSIPSASGTTSLFLVGNATYSSGSYRTYGTLRASRER